MEKSSPPGVEIHIIKSPKGRADRHNILFRDSIKTSTKASKRVHFTDHKLGLETLARYAES